MSDMDRPHSTNQPLASPETPWKGDCHCRAFCGDSDPDGPGICKDLPRRRTPLVELVLIDKRTGHVV